MTYRVRVVPQLKSNDGPWKPYDCWVSSARGLIAFASNGKVKIDAETARRRSGRWTPNPTLTDLRRLGPGNLVDIKRILTHPDTVLEFKHAGMHPPKVRDLENTKAATVFHYLRQGYQAAVAIHYGTLREIRPRATGSETFSDGHSVRWYGWYGTDGKPATAAPFLTDQLDPLCDGRRAGIAEGPQRLNRRVLLAETAAVELHDGNGNVVGHVGKGNVLALVVKPSQPLDSEPVEPPPTDDPCADCDSQLAAEQADNDRLRAAIRAIAAALTESQAPLNVIAGITNDPANGGGVE